MNNRVKIIIIGFAFLMINACANQPTSQSKNVLVLDLPTIAKAIDRDTEMNQQMEKFSDKLNQQLDVIKVKLEKQLKEHQQKLKSNKNKKSKLQFQEFINQAQQKMQQVQLKASQKIQAYRTSLLQNFKDEIKPIAKNIAKKHNASLVRYSDDSILWFSQTIDISNEVIAVLKLQSKNKSSDSIDKKK